MSEFAQWFETNLPALLALPVGSLVTVGLDIIRTTKKSRDLIKQYKENKDIMQSVKAQASNSQVLLSDTRILADNCIKSINQIQEHIADTDKLVQEDTEKFDKVLETLNTISVRLDKIEKIQSIITSNDTELVKSGKASEITKITKGA